VDVGARGLAQVLVVPTHAAIASQPGEGALHHPASWSSLEPWTWWAIGSPGWALDDLDGEPLGLLGPIAEAAAVASIGPEVVESGEVVSNAIDHESAAHPIRDVGRMDAGSQQQSGGIDQQMPLAPVYLLAAVVASDPPFSVVLTDWLSKIPALGWACRPCCSRTWSRNASWTRSQVPSRRQSRW
jgi:hypothetical protein